jgi:hypothetical protein
MHPSERQGNNFRMLFSVREESRFPLQTRIGKTTCNHPDARATSSGRCLNKETREAHYGKAIAVYRLDALSLRPDATQRTPNQC